MELFQILDKLGSESICTTLGPILDILRSILLVIQIGIPILLILMGTIDLGKAVLSSDDKAIKESTSRLIKRVIAAVAVFFVATIVRLLMDVLSKSNISDADATAWMQCWDKGKKGDDEG